MPQDLNPPLERPPLSRDPYSTPLTPFPPEFMETQRITVAQLESVNFGPSGWLMEEELKLLKHIITLWENRASDWPLLQVSNPSPSTPPTGLAPFRTTMILTAGLGQLRPYDDDHRYFLANSGRTVNNLRPFGPTPAELFIPFHYVYTSPCLGLVFFLLLTSHLLSSFPVCSRKYTLGFLAISFIADLLPVTLGPKYLLRAQLQPAISMTGSRSS
ncbi:hypothetical protein PCANC_10720 [Puccinia coronata f. sp. avenae]|uniref:Uncharacterized protein n=1 Tax=Puccinia coronata f. sp. avenae TaxID=200324 RepID=A0A2N5VSV6_9BASI|nr:hypothetical protein PCANC_10720 [Puccinia coronata f. sp. avenae]